MKKKILAFVLSLVMMASTAIPSIQAASAEDPKPNLYVFDLESMINQLPDSTVQYDYLKFATALQGLANRTAPQIYYHFKTNSFAAGYGVNMDDYWLNKLSDGGEYLSQFNQVKVTDFWALVAQFRSVASGLVVWDNAVPATANVASTAAGADSLLPVRYDTSGSSLYTALLAHGFTVEDIKLNLVGKFTGTGKIPDSATASTGSAKNDAYIWAKEQYLDTGKTSASLMTYSLDAWTKPVETGTTPERGAELISVQLPKAMEAGSSAKVEVTLKNIGTETWEETGIGSDPGSRLGRCDDAKDFAWSGTGGDPNVHDRAFVTNGTKVKTGETYTFTFTITAPKAAGSYPFKVQMVRDGKAWFGPALNRTIQVVDLSASAVDLSAEGVISAGGSDTVRNAEFTAASLPSVMIAGSSCGVTVTAKNLGTEVWQETGNGADPGTRLGRSDGYDQLGWKDGDGDPNVINRAFTHSGEQIAKDGSCTFDFTVTAPAAAGEVTFKAQMIRDGVAWFGPVLTKTITVMSPSDFVPTEEMLAGSSTTAYPDLMNTMLPNADYYIANKAFFWDLSPDDSIAPIDDRTQPVGTDVATLKKLLLAQAGRAGDAIFTVSGFVPWWLKYTTTSDPAQSTMGDVASEWKMVDIISSYHGQLDADAYGMTSLSNASVFSKVPLRGNLKQSNDKGQSGTTVYDKDTKYILFYMGDYDAGSWTSGCLPLLWDDAERGTLPLAWPVCADLSQRVPQVFNYLYKTATANDYFVAGDNGTGYLNPMFLEGDRVPDGMTSSLEIWKNHNIASNEKFDIDITGFLIAGNAGVITPTVQQAYSEMSPDGVVYQGSVTPGNEIYNETPFVPYWDIGGQISSSQAAGVAASIENRLKNNGQFHVFRSVLTAPSVINDIVEKLKQNYPDQKFEVLDPYTFMRLFRESEGGTVAPAPITYEAQEAEGITIDGTAGEEEWKDAAEIVVSPSSEVVKGIGTNWNVDASDPLNASYRIKWDSNNLYLTEKRIDDVLLPMNNSDAMDYLRCDATMLFLDLNGAKGSAFSAGDYAVYIAPVGSDGKPVVFLRNGQNGPLIERKLSADEYQAAVRTGENGNYELEIALPWSLFQTVAFELADQMTVGMTVLAIDHDVTTDNGGRQIMWCGSGDDQQGWAAMKFAAKADTCSVTVECGENGAVTPGSGVFECGKEYTFTATPKDGYVLDMVLLDGKAIAVSDNSFSLTFTGDSILKVSFRSAQSSSSEGEGEAPSGNSSSGSGTNPATGGNTSVWPLAALAIGILAAGITLMLRRRAESV